MQTLLQDIRFALRLLAKSPGSTAVIVLMLAIGIGMTSAIFSFVNGLLLRPLALPEIDRIAFLWESNPRKGRPRVEVGPANFQDWLDQSRAFEHLTAYQWWDVHLTGGGGVEQVQGFRVSSGFFEALRVNPGVGRALEAADEQPGRDDVVVVSYVLWQRRFGGDPTLLGKPISLNGRSHTVVGIMPRGFEFPATAELWMPLVLRGNLAAEREDRFLNVFGRLKPGVNLERARSEMKVIANRLALMYPRTNEGWTAEVASVRDWIDKDTGTRDPLAILMVAAGCVWLLGCANVVNLQMALATSRRQEFAIRTALGANPGRLIRQLLVESLILAIVGGLASLLVAALCIHGIKISLPADVARYLPGWKTVGLDGYVLAFTMVVALATGILSGIAPAMLTSHSRPYETLKESVRGSTLGRAHQWLRSSLVVVEVTLALVMLVSAGLLLQGFLAMLHGWRGFDSHNVLTFRVSLPATTYPTGARVSTFVDRALEGFSTIPGVKAVGAGIHLPFNQNGWGRRALRIEGCPSPDGKDFQVVVPLSVSPGCFQTLKIPLQSGRTFAASDAADAPKVVVISESLARRYWTNDVVLGKRIQLPVGRGPDQPYFTIIGVVGDVRLRWGEPDLALIYCPFAQAPEPAMLFALRTEVDPLSVISPLRSQLQKVDPLVPITNVKPYDQIIADSIVSLRFPSNMLTFLGLLTLLLAAVGVYSVLAYMVRQRTQEIGIRMALGAQRADVMRLVLGTALRMLAVGTAIGVPIAFACGRILSSLLFGVGYVRIDVIAFAILLMATTALLAALVPARQAIRVDPIIALRNQ